MHKIQYFIVPDDIFSNAENWQYVMPIFMQIRFRTDFTGRCTTSPIRLLKACGYKYLGPNKSKQQLEKVTETLNYLVSEDFFYDPVDATTGEEITDFKNISPSTFFEVTINEDLCNTSVKGFCPIYPYLYEKLYKSYEKAAGVKLWRLLVIFCYFSKHVWKNWSFKYCMEDVELYKKQRFENPEYYGATISHICERLGSSFSRSTVEKAIEYLDKYEIVHRRKIGSILSDNGSLIPLGSVFVLDKFGWKDEIEGATVLCRLEREQYFTKQPISKEVKVTN